MYFHALDHFSQRLKELVVTTFLLVLSATEVLRLNLMQW